MGKQMWTRTLTVAGALVLVLFAWVSFAACGSDGAGGSADGGANDGELDRAAQPVTSDASVAVDAGGADASRVDAAAPDAGFDAGASVLQHHHDAARTGLYVDPLLTKAKVTASFGLRQTWPIAGPVYAAPLFVEGAINGKDALIIATEQNTVIALDAHGTTPLWQTPVLAPPVKLVDLQAEFQANPGCGNIDPLGITGTPIVDLPSRTLYVAAMTTPDNGVTKRHLVFALSIDDGSVKPGWPVDVEAAFAGAPTPFVSYLQNQRGALALVNGILYVPYGGHVGDCGVFHGWIVGVDVATPTKVLGWATPGNQGGAWSVSGVSSDGTATFMTTGNTNTAEVDAAAWKGGDGVLRFSRGPVFSGSSLDFFAPSNWIELDAMDQDVSASGAVLADVAGATPSALLVVVGKDGNMFLLDRKNLGGVGGYVSTAHLVDGAVIGATALYPASPNGMFASIRIHYGNAVSCPNGTTGNLVTVKIGATNPPTVTPVWCSDQTDLAPAIASTTTAGGADALVWATGTKALFAYDGVTGAPVYAGGTPADAFLGKVHYFQTPIIARGRVYVAGFDHAYAFGP